MHPANDDSSPDHAPAAAVPVQAATHTTVIASDYPMRVDVHADHDGGGRWFRLLNWLVDSGALSRLTPSATTTLIVLARHANDQALSCPALATLLSQTGLRKSSVYKAIDELRSSPDRLLAIDDLTQAWVVFPGRSFARRRPGVPAPPVHGDGKYSTGVDSRVHRRGNLSTGVESPPTPPLRSERSDSGSRPDGGPPAAASIELLVSRSGGGFSQREAQVILEETGATAQQVQDAVDSAHAMRRRGRLKSSVKKFVRWNLRTERGLFDEALEDRERATPNVAAATPDIAAGPAASPMPHPGPLPTPPWRRGGVRAHRHETTP